MNRIAGFSLLALAMLGTGTYRYGLVYRLIAEKPGFVGLTLFTGLLFAPSVTAFAWRTALERRGRLAAGAALVGSAWLAIALAAQHSSAYAVYWTMALTLGALEALLLPTLQSWFSEGGEKGLAEGMSILFAMTCMSLVASPIMLKWTEPIPLSAVGACGVAALLVLTTRLETRRRAPASSPPVAFADRATLAVLFVVGAALGVLSNMIYPIALRVLKLDGALVGLYACVPMLSASCGASLRGRLGGTRDAWALGAALLLPAALLIGPSAFLPVTFAWGVCLGFTESGWLSRRGNFTHAMSSKYVGVAAGIALSGALAQYGLGPMTAVAAAFYAILVSGGALWVAY